MGASIWNPGGQQQVPALPAVAPVSFVKGLISNPGINFVGDTDTGIWSESDGYLNFVCNGVTQLRIDPNGNVTANKLSGGVELQVASAAVTDIGTPATNSVQITGNSTITSFGTTYRGPMFVRFQSALVLTHNSTQLICPGAANLSINAGDSIVVTPKATGGVADGWVVVSYTSISPNLNAVTSINGGQLAGLRNRIINGGMQVAQRGTSGSLTGYTTDRWLGYCTGAVASWNQYTGIVPSAPLGYYFQINGVAGNTAVSIAQRMEAANSMDLAGKTVTISYWVYQTTGSTQSAYAGVAYATAGTDNFTSVSSFTNTASTSVPSATWTKVSGTITIPSAGTTGLHVAVIPVGGNGVLAGQIVLVYGVQLEIGSVATPFEQRPYGMELALCQRYYEVGNGYFSGYAGASSDWRSLVNFKQTKRAIPTLTYTPAAFSNVSVYDIRLPTVSDAMWFCTAAAVGGFLWQGSWAATAEL